jgi:hypothetical protein
MKNMRIEDLSDIEERGCAEQTLEDIDYSRKKSQVVCPDTQKENY